MILLPSVLSLFLFLFTKKAAGYETQTFSSRAALCNSSPRNPISQKYKYTVWIHRVNRPKMTKYLFYTVISTFTSPTRPIEIVFPLHNNFWRSSVERPEIKMKFEGNKIKCFPRDQTLRDLLYSPRRKNSALLSCDVIHLVVLPAQRFWRETVSLLDVMWPWSDQCE